MDITLLTIGRMMKSFFHLRVAITLLFLLVMAPAGHGQTSVAARGKTELSCRQIAVIGAVRKPSRLNAPLRMRLLEVLVHGGGPNERAGKTVRVIHTCHCSPCDKIARKAGDTDEYNLADVLRGLKSGNPQVAPGDLVIVPEAGSVFVIGNVVGGRRVRFSEGMTVTMAIAVAGVAVGHSELVTVRIYRNSSDGPGHGPIIVRLNAVLDGRAENVLLRPWDIVEVSDALGHFPSQKLSPPIWDPLLMPRKDNSGS